MMNKFFIASLFVSGLLMHSVASAETMQITISVSDPTSEAVVAKIEPGKNTTLNNGPLPFVHCNLDRNCQISTSFDKIGYLYVQLLDKYGEIVQASNVSFTDEAVSESFGILYMEFAPQVFNKYPR